MNLGKFRAHRPAGCSPTGGHKKTIFGNPSRRDEKPTVWVGGDGYQEERRGVGESLGPARAEVESLRGACLGL